jgi:maleylpyruvate isomerase
MTDSGTKLHGFFRSGASYRVRVALALKGIAYDGAFYRLRSGEQRAEAYLALNPQGLVPALEIDGVVLTRVWPSASISTRRTMARSCCRRMP